MADSARIEELRRRVELDPASIAFASLAEEYRRAGQFDDAIAVCEAGLQRHPAYVSARVTMGRSLIEIGRYDEARLALEQVLRSAPENLAAIRGLAEIHHRAGNVPENESSYTEAELNPDRQLDPEPPPLPPSPPAALHYQPIPLSGVPAVDAAPVQVTAAPAPVATAPVTPAAVPVPVPLATAPAPVVRAPHPDERALPPLESFLAAIVAARSSARQHTN